MVVCFCWNTGDSGAIKIFDRTSLIYVRFHGQLSSYCYHALCHVFESFAKKIGDGSTCKKMKKNMYSHGPYAILKVMYRSLLFNKIEFPFQMPLSLCFLRLLYHTPLQYQRQLLWIGGSINFSLHPNLSFSTTSTGAATRSFMVWCPTKKRCLESSPDLTCDKFI